MYVFFLKFACPNITGVVERKGSAGVQEFALFTSSSGAFNFTQKLLTGINYTGQVYGSNSFGFDASRSNSIYGGSSTVQPKSLNLSILIKY